MEDAGFMREWLITGPIFFNAVSGEAVMLAWAGVLG
jgi:hypothetical protein